MAVDHSAAAILRTVSAATITSVLDKTGFRNVWARGARPLRRGQSRVVRPPLAFRLVADREDPATPAPWASPVSTYTAIEAMLEDCGAVVDAMGATEVSLDVMPAEGPEQEWLEAWTLDEITKRASLTGRDPRNEAMTARYAAIRL